MSLFLSCSHGSLTPQLVGLGASLSRSSNKSSSAMPLPSSWHLYLHFCVLAGPHLCKLACSFRVTEQYSNQERSPSYTAFPSPFTSPRPRWVQRAFQRWALCVWIAISEDTSLQLSSAWEFYQKTRSRLLQKGFELCSGMYFEKRNASIAWGRVTGNREWQHPLTSGNRGRKMWPMGKYWNIGEISHKRKEKGKKNASEKKKRWRDENSRVGRNIAKPCKEMQNRETKRDQWDWKAPTSWGAFSSATQPSAYKKAPYLLKGEALELTWPTAVFKWNW